MSSWYRRLKFKSEQAGWSHADETGSRADGSTLRGFRRALPRSRHGNTILLVYHDGYSMFVELVPLRRATAAHLQTAFRERILSWFWVPKKFVCDNGVQFTSRSFKYFLESLGVEVQFTVPYCPQENINKMTTRTVRTMFIEGHQSSWDELLSEISLAVNTSVADLTGFSPAFLMQGWEPWLPVALYDQVTPGSATSAFDPRTNADRLREIFYIAHSNIQRASKDQGRQYNLRRQEWRPSLDSMVLLRQNQLSNDAEGFAAISAPKFVGPYRVTRFVSPNIVRLVRPNEQKKRVANISQLKPFYQDMTDEKPGPVDAHE
ncbi:uncharacterized protein LOC135439651 [Drosophila montana]|uniref:uncharacterized protein LOC135439651 n=1 Tax=Drosophila montana TaxID=40370 RepID=UPI00313EC842